MNEIVKPRINLKKALLANNIYLIFLALFIVCSVISKDFFTLRNMVNICQQYASVVIISIGMLMVILTGGIDLSVGSIMALGCVVSAYMMKNLELPILLSIFMALVCGGLAGGVSGVLVAKTNMAPFIATLAMMTMASGGAFMLSNGAPIITVAGTISVLGTGTFFPFLTYLTTIAIVVVVAAWFVLKYTSYGRMIVAIGSNEESVRLSGINVKPLIISVYAVSGVCSALGGVISTSRTGIGTASVGTSMELDCIAACVIGGASLTGGSGSALKTVIGVLVLALIGNIMNLLAIPSYPQDVIKGVIIIVAVLMQNITNKVQ